MSTGDGKPSSAGGNVTAGLDLLDFLFTFFLGLGLVPEVFDVPRLSGVLSEEWRRNGTWPTLNEWEHLATLFLGLTTLTLSWFGYHASIRTTPIGYGSPFGLARFQIDVFLVVLYGVVMLLFRHFGWALVAMVVIHMLFVTWDYLKAREQGIVYMSRPSRSDPEFGVQSERFRRQLASWVWLSAFLLLGLFAGVFPEANLLWIVIAILFGLFFRLHKLGVFNHMSRQAKSQ